MKNKLFFILCFFALIACKSDGTKIKSKTNKLSSVTQKSSLIEDFDCSVFFNQGNYASVCFSDSKNLKFQKAGCIFSFETLGDTQLEALKAQFTLKGSSSLAEMHFNLAKHNYKKGRISKVSNLGHDAFFDEHKDDLKSLSRSHKDLYVRYEHLVFVLFAEYMSNSTKPCFYNDQDLIDFAQKIIDHL